MANQVVWFDIPVKNLERAMQFYAAVLDVKVDKQVHGTFAIATFPHEGNDVGGCLAPADEENKPSEVGPLLYLRAEGRLDAAVTAAGANGGKVVKPKHPIGPYGFRAVVIDSEGNRVALHSTVE